MASLQTTGATPTWTTPSASAMGLRLAIQHNPHARTLRQNSAYMSYPLLEKNGFAWIGVGRQEGPAGAAVQADHFELRYDAWCC